MSAETTDKGADRVGAGHTPAGRELDAAVAEAMGLCLHREPAKWRTVRCQGDSPDHYCNLCGEDPEPCPHFSTDIAAAWQVFVRGMQAAGYATIHADMEDYGRGLFTRGESEGVVTVTIGDYSATEVAPLAICYAALSAFAAIAAEDAGCPYSCPTCGEVYVFSNEAADCCGSPVKRTSEVEP